MAGRTARDVAAPGEGDRSASLAAVAAGHRSLEEVIRWATGQVPPAEITEVIVQDEFTHDVVVSVGDLWLVYDTT